MSDSECKDTREANTVEVSPQELKEQIDFDDGSPIWKYLFAQRLVSSVVADGIWVANAGSDSIDCVADLVVTRTRKQIHLFCRDPTNEIAVQAAVDVLHHLVKVLLENSEDNGDGIKLGISALDRRLLPTFRTSLEERYEIISSYDYPCGLWIQNDTDTTNTQETLQPPNVKLRPINQDDAELLNSRWSYKSDTSISMVKKMIALGGCHGLEVDGNLVAWACQYLDGPLGMLWTEEGHRRKGYGALVVQEAMAKPRTEPWTKHPWICCIVDSNTDSQKLFTRLNWKRLSDTDWIGFTLRKKE